MSKYEKLETVGEGAYGVVLKCRHKETGEIVAVKKFKEREEDLDEATRKVILREVKVLKALKHENIIELKEAFRRKGQLHIVFEYFGKSMLEVIEANAGGLEAEVVRTVVCQATRALEYCHRHHVLHRDIKPENLLIDTRDYQVRLCDFGCARKMPEAGVELTDYVATRWYRPPELLVGSVDYGTAVDMWGLACLTGELTDGQPLFAGKSDIDQLFVIQKIMGQLTATQVERFLLLSSAEGVRFPPFDDPVTLKRRYEGKMGAAQLQFMEGCLQLDPATRLSAQAALQLPWLAGAKLPAALQKPVPSSQAQPSKSRGPGRKQGTGLEGGQELGSTASQWAGLQPRAVSSSSSVAGPARHGGESPLPPPMPGLIGMGGGGAGAGGVGHAAAGAGMLPAIRAPGMGAAAPPRAPVRKQGTESEMPPIMAAVRLQSREKSRTGGRQGSRSASPDALEALLLPFGTKAGRRQQGNPYSLPWEPSSSPGLVAPDYSGGDTALPLFPAPGGGAPVPAGAGLILDKKLSGTGRLLLASGGGDMTPEDADEGPIGGPHASAAKIRIGGRDRRWSGA